MTWTAESVLLLDATSVRPNDETVCRLRRRISRELNWGELLRIAIPHGVLPLLARNVSTYAADVVSPPILGQLQRFANIAAERSKRQSREVVSLSAMFSRAGIRALPFKGPALAAAAYGDAGLRESHDLDFWTDPREIARAGQCLRQAGYTPMTHLQGVAVQVSDAGCRQFEYASSDGEVLVELRGQLEGGQFPVGCQPGFEEMWARRSSTTLYGQEIPALAVEDLIIGLAVHASKHMWRRLSWVVDIAAVASASPLLDWDAALRRATELQCRRRLLLACALANELYTVELPRRICDATRGRTIRAVVSRIRGSLFNDQQVRSLRTFGAEIAYHLQVCESAPMRVKIARRSMRRVLRADDRQIFPPMSEDLSLIYRALAFLRRLA